MDEFVKQIKKSQDEKYALMVQQVQSQLENGASAKDLNKQSAYTLNNPTLRADLCFEAVMDIKKVMNCETGFR